MSAPLELFHQIAHPESARARRYVVDQALEDRVRMRNVTYPEVQADFAARGGSTLPALWDGEQLYQGAEAVIARMSRIVDIGRDN